MTNSNTFADFLEEIHKIFNITKMGEEKQNSLQGTSLKFQF
jgi:hypothetical protein